MIASEIPKGIRSGKSVIKNGQAIYDYIIKVKVPKNTLTRKICKANGIPGSKKM